MKLKLTREETIRVLEICNSGACELCPLYENDNCIELRDSSAIHYLKEKKPAPSGNGTSSNENILHIDDTTLLDICQEGLIKIGDRIAECADGDDYILGYVHAILDVVEQLTGGDDNV